MELVMGFVEDHLMVDVFVTIFAIVMEIAARTRFNIVERNLNFQLQATLNHLI